MKISELSQATGVDVDTIRYYEKSGLMPAPARETNGYRSYGPAHLERLAFVRHCRALDMPLADVQRLLDVVDGHTYWMRPGDRIYRHAPMVNDPANSTVAELARTAVAWSPHVLLRPMGPASKEGPWIQRRIKGGRLPPRAGR